MHLRLGEIHYVKVNADSVAGNAGCQVLDFFLRLFAGVGVRVKVNRVHFHAAPHHSPAGNRAVYAAAQKQKTASANANGKAANSFFAVGVDKNFFADFYKDGYVGPMHVDRQNFFVVDAGGGLLAYCVGVKRECFVGAAAVALKGLGAVFCGLNAKLVGGVLYGVNRFFNDHRFCPAGYADQMLKAEFYFFRKRLIRRKVHSARAQDDFHVVRFFKVKAGVLQKLLFKALDVRALKRKLAQFCQVSDHAAIIQRIRRHLQDESRAEKNARSFSY